MTNVTDFIEEFTTALVGQLDSDRSRYGDTWLQRFPDGQEARIWERIQTYFDQFRNASVPIPWLKIAGLATIAWVREAHPEIWEDSKIGKVNLNESNL